MVTPDDIFRLLDQCLTARAGLFDAEHRAAFRLFNGFTEGCPDLVVDLYAHTLVLNNYATQVAPGAELAAAAQQHLLARLPWVRAVVLKTRHATDPDARRGVRVYGQAPDQEVREQGVRYAVDLCLNLDASLYLDTRNLRAWARTHLQGKTVLNAFAFTGSLGVAAAAGGAARVVQLDRNPRFLEVAKASCALNGLPVVAEDYLAHDFWPAISHLKRTDARFDCVIVDPPFFAATHSGTVDLANDCTRVINKVRPLVADSGYLVAVNNALFLSGQAYMQALETLCADGYLAVAELIPVPADFTGYPETRLGMPMTDPAPFNHATKIAVLRVRRKIP